MIPIYILCSINIQHTVTIQEIEMYWVTTLFIIVRQLDSRWKPLCEDESRTLDCSLNSNYIWNVKVALFGLLPIRHLFESQRLLLSKLCHRRWQLYPPQSKHINKILQKNYLIVNKRKQGHPDENLAKISLNTDERFKRAWTRDLRLNLPDTVVTKAQHNNSNNNNNGFVSFACSLLDQTSLLENDELCISVPGKWASIMVGYYLKDEATKASYESRSDTWKLARFD